MVKAAIYELLNCIDYIDTRDHGNGGYDCAGAAADEKDPTPTLREVEDAIHQLKINKAAGKDGIAAEVIRKLTPASTG